ncbi:deazaflavin-dependent nitroreductase family protein [Mycolicibacterium fortuitum]|uniref:Deazaflavin-dependent nitroreductase family protein n=1 Tax=Mycolicibacterium fortuitum TaxID=1766 RepID=A0A378WEC7_MYCFO|nr:deazaflavin-dependent nitroreductase family protein [Mycolicibacterium fortuitum]
MANNWNDQIIAEFRANGGKVGGPFEGATLLLLHTTGAKSGKERVSPVMAFDLDGKLAIVGSYAGADVDPAWLHNLRPIPMPTSRSAPTPTTCVHERCRGKSGMPPILASSRRHRASVNTKARPTGSSRSSSCSAADTTQIRVPVSGTALRQ